MENGAGPFIEHCGGVEQGESVELNEKVEAGPETDQPARPGSEDTKNPMFWIAIGAIAVVIGAILFFTVGTWITDTIVVNTLMLLSN